MTLHIAPAGVFQKSGSSVEDGLHKKLLEYSGIGFTLITAMSFRLVIALLMGLVIQLTQAWQATNNRSNVSYQTPRSSSPK